MKMKQEEAEIEDEQKIKELLRRYELKKLTYRQMIEIYQKNAFRDEFKNTLYSTLFLVFAPGLTNIYYTFRPNSSLAKIMPWVMPVVSVLQYYVTLKRDLEAFCFVDTQDSEQMRRKYQILNRYELQSRHLKQIGENIHEFKGESEKKSDE